MISVMVIGACLFGEPNLGGTSFACDDDHPCPAGQACVMNRCRGGAGGDGGNPGGPGVACGAAGTCGAGQQCCAITVGAPVCQPLGEACAGKVAECDGAGDCGAGMACCGSSSDAACGEASCSSRVCTVDLDCGGATPKCCFFNPIVPWGQCALC